MATMTTTPTSPSPFPFLSPAPAARKSLETLPTELLSQILSHLPLHSLLTFAVTSSHNYALARSTLSEIHLACFQRRIHGVLAFLNADDSASFLNDSRTYPYHQIITPAPSSPTQRDSVISHRRPVDASQAPPAQVHRTRQINAQNTCLTSILSCSILAGLSSLTIRTVALLSPSLSSIIATNLPRLRHLTLNFSHPCIHDAALPARYWETCPGAPREGTPAWNALAGLGEEHERVLRVRGLETLSVRRAAVTRRQLHKWIEMNPALRKLQLDLVAGVDLSFVQELAKMSLEGGRARLRVLELERCANLMLKEEGDFEWLETLVENRLEELSLKGCEGVDPNTLRKVCRERGWMEKGLIRLVCPDEVRSRTDAELEADEEGPGTKWSKRTTRSMTSRDIEVDPAYMAYR